MVYRVMIALLIIVAVGLIAGPVAVLAAEDCGDCLENDALIQQELYASSATKTAVTGRPKVTTGSGIVSNSKELYHMISDGHEDIITLANDIYWDFYADKLEVQSPVTVKMGDCSIYVAKGSGMHVEGPIRFEGSGSVAPLFCIEGSFGLQGAEIAATGDDGTAVLVHDSTWFNLTMTTVISSGRNSVTVELRGSKDYSLDAVNISAKGHGSVAVRSEGPVKFCMSSVTGQQASVVAPEVVADSSRIYPLPSECSFIDRYAATCNRIEQNGISLPVGTDIGRLKAIVSQYEEASCFEIRDKDGSKSPLFISFAATVENMPDSLQEAGRYELLCLPQVPEWFPVEINEYVIPLNVVAEDSPFILDAYDAGEGVLLRFFRPIKGADEIILEYRVDDSYVWQAASGLPGFKISTVEALIEEIAVNHSYYFRLVVKGGPMEGESNVLEYLYFDNMANNNGGGDRDNGDRGDQGPNLPSIDSKPSHDDSSIGDDNAVPAEKSEPYKELPVAAEPDKLSADEGDGIPVMSLVNNSLDDIKNDIMYWGCYAEAFEKPDMEDAEIEHIDDENTDGNHVDYSKEMNYTLFLSQEELKAYISLTDNLTVIEDGVRVVIPAESIQTAWLTNEYSFGILITRDEDSLFEVRFWADGQETVCPDFTAYIRYEGFDDADNYEEYYCENISDLSDEDEIVQAEGCYEGSLMFELSKGGRYSIEHTQSLNEDGPSAAVPLKAEHTDIGGGQSNQRGVAAGGVLLIVAVGIALLSCRRRKGGAM